MFEIVETQLNGTVIKVFGVGGAGGSAINQMVSAKIKGIEFIAVNTDAQALNHNGASIKVHIGKSTTRGLGAGMDPDLGGRAAEENEEDWPGLEIPVDKEDADIIYTVNAREPKHYPEDLAEAAILFHLAGENWTVPSVGWEETSLAMFAGDWEGCRLQVQAVYDAMERLKPKRMVVTECGHAYRATVIEGPYWAGLKSGKTPVPSFHYVEWVAEALRTGKLKLDPAKKIKEPVTYQDSCNYIRNAGLSDCAREIMSYIAEDFREMRPNREHNFCCGGGGGMNGLGRYRQERNVGLKVKRDQILATGAKLVITPGHNCWDAVRDLEEVYKVGIRWSFLKPILLKMVIVPDHMKPEE